MSGEERVNIRLTKKCRKKYCCQQTESITHFQLKLMFESKQTEQSQMTVNQTESIIQLSIKLEGTRALIGLSVKAVTCNTM